jgi:uracil-DNA glycosylase
MREAPKETLWHLLPEDWRAPLAHAREEPWFEELGRFVREERAREVVYPPNDEVFAALAHTPFCEVKVVLLGQDPYHGDGQAHGLCFSVRAGIKPPRSLVNLFKELEADIGVEPPAHGSLVPWAAQGVLLLNAVLTVRANAAGSHAKRGWERFTDEVLLAVASRAEPCVFMLWGSYAQKKAPLVEGEGRVVLEATHPSPLSAHRGFFGSRPFSQANDALRRLGLSEVDWRL